MKPKHYFNIAVMGTVITIAFTSCFPGGVPDPYIVAQSRQEENFYYTPSAHNAPLIKEKHDLNFNAALSSGTLHSGSELRGSFLPGKHFGITAAYSSGGNKSRGTVRHNRLELGAGYITKLSNQWHFETYGGWGTGNIDNSHYTGTSHVKLSHFFIQPAFAITNDKKTVRLGLVSRFAGVNFKVTDTSFATDREPFSNAQLISLYEKPFRMFWEPCIVLRYGWKVFQFHTAYSVSVGLGNDDLHRSKSNFSLGVSLQFNTDKKKKSSQP
ncbi:MAG: hypothetical protein SFU87_15060 [Chitinophagaceae bacterium]|nr:hypothetical protein [Chitinophagaceae bacterium]